MTHIRPNLRLYLANRTWVILTPIYILLGMTAISLVIGAILGIVTGFPLPEGTEVRMTYNAGALYCIPGFLVSVGALAMNRNFSMALAFGATRRHFWLGTSLGFLLTSLTVGLGSVALLGLEIATNHWFFNARAFDVDALGNGDPLRTFLTMFVLAVLSLYIGALFGTIFRAFGPVWVTLTAIALGIVFAGAIALAVARWSDLSPAVQTIGPWLALVVASGLTVLAAAGSYVVNRVAAV